MDSEKLIISYSMSQYVRQEKHVFNHQDTTSTKNNSVILCFFGVLGALVLKLLDCRVDQSS